MILGGADPSFADGHDKPSAREFNAHQCREAVVEFGAIWIACDLSTVCPLGLIACTRAFLIAITDGSFALFAGLLLFEVTSSRTERTGCPVRFASLAASC